MKWNLWLALLIGCAAAAHGQTASVNTVSYILVPVPGTNAAPAGTAKLTMVAVPFVPVGTGMSNGAFTLDKVLGAGFHAGLTTDTADQVLFWNPAATNYLTAFLNRGGTDTNTWYKWCYLAGTNAALCATNAAYNVYPGRGLWIRNRGAYTNLLLLGEVPGGGLATNAVSVGLQMIAYPYPVTTNVQQLITTNDGAYANGSPDAADQMIFWTGTNYFTVFLNDASGPEPSLYGKWCYLQGQRRVLATNEVRPGDGFWYRRRGAGTFQWIETKPYNWP